MKRIIASVLTMAMMCGASFAFAGCSGQTKAEKNSIAFLEVLYNCPTEDFSKYFKEAACTN